MQNSTTTKTNDMVLATDGSMIITGQFRPSNLNNMENSGHLIKSYGTDLNYLPPDVIANDQEHANTASLIYRDNTFSFIAPSSPVVGGQVKAQRDLLLVRYSSTWNIVGSSSTKLVDSNTLTHTNTGDGIWMSTGSAYDSVSNSLIVGHTFVDGTGGSDAGQLFLRIYDGTSFIQTGSTVIVDSRTANRVHFLLLNNTLFMVYDDKESGSPTIYALKYTIQRSRALPWIMVLLGE